MTLTDTLITRQQQRSLHDGWTLELASGWAPEDIAGAVVPATVPGSVHTDLLAAGLIPDPYLDDNERMLAWIGSADWRYRLDFDWSDDGFDRVDLAFDGLDTVAELTLNGVPVGSTRNMHRRYRFSVRELLRPGRNELVVEFGSPVRYADAASLELGYRPHVNHHPYNAIRKMACNFGWDWGIDAATAGIWRPVTLHSWSGARIASVRPLARPIGDGGRLEAHVEVERSSATGPLTFDVEIDGRTAAATIAVGSDVGVAVLDLDEVRRWWPVGHGSAELYEVSATLADDGRALDRWVSRVGFRDIRVEHTPDEHGTPFTIVVNDRPIFIKGANWIPDDAFVHRVDRKRYDRRIEQALDANLNLLRVWGGGIYEAEDFYELCDERGLLVWQDFLFACASYSEEEPMRSEVEAEARDNVTRLSTHPSLALWNGNNENVWGFYDWGWEKRLEGKSWGLGYYLDLLPSIIAELDPERAYTPGSPWSFDTGRHPNDPVDGSIHEWEVWNRQDYPKYREIVPRFIAEFGWQGPPTWSTLTRSLSDSPLTPESPGMLVHQKAVSGNDKLTDGLVPHLPFPSDMDGWHWAMQLNQARAVAYGVEHYRSWSPRCAGSIIWQLNDCWPVTSWAAIDGDGRIKPLYHAIRSAHADRLVTIQPRDDGLAVVVVNDTDEVLDGELVTRRLDFAGGELAASRSTLSVGPRETVTVPIEPAVAEAGAPTRELIESRIGDLRGFWDFVENRDAELEPARVDIAVRAEGDDTVVTLTARNLVRDATILADRLAPDASASHGLVTLLPGESLDIRLEGVVADAAAVAAPEVLRSANELVAGR